MAVGTTRLPVLSDAFHLQRLQIVLLLQFARVGVLRPDPELDTSSRFDHIQSIRFVIASIRKLSMLAESRMLFARSASGKSLNRRSSTGPGGSSGSGGGKAAGSGSRVAESLRESSDWSSSGAMSESELPSAISSNSPSTRAP